jgi:sugar lactone lactonase YvrE
VAFSPDGKQVASCGGVRDPNTKAVSSKVILHDVFTGQVVRTFTTGLVECLAYSPDGERLALGGYDGEVRLWQVSDGRELSRIRGHTASIRSIAFHPDGRVLASGSQDGTVKLWDPSTGRVVRAIECARSPNYVRGVAFSPSGERLASTSTDGSVKVWNTATGELYRTLDGHSFSAKGLSWSSDGQRLATASWDQTVKVWDPNTGQELVTLKGHTIGVQTVSFTADGRRLASAGLDGTAKLWDLTTGQEVLTLKRHTGELNGAVFSPDGTWLASAGIDGTVRLWDARPLTPEVRAEVEAVGLLDFLFSRPLPTSEVRAAIRRDQSITEATRQKALELAERFKEESDPQKYHDAAWPVLRHPYANVFVCRLALAQMNAACERAPDHALYRLGLGVAQYRLGKFHKERYPDALATLSKCDPNHPTMLAFLAMTQQQLGQKEQARTTLARLRELMKQPPWTTDAEVKLFLREASELIEGSPKPAARPATGGLAPR